MTKDVTKLASEKVDPASVAADRCSIERARSASSSMAADCSILG